MERDPAPTISVIVAAYNAAPTLRHSVLSIQAQTLRNIEILIVDDCSRDDTLEVARAISGEDSRVRVIACAENGGPAAARNAGLDAARGEWIAVVDSDDEIPPERLAAMLAAGTDADIVFDNLLFITAGATPVPYIPSHLDVAGELTLRHFVESHRVACPTPNLGFLKPLIRRSVIERHHQRYDAKLKIGEDALLIMALLAQGARARLLPEAYYGYHRNEGSISSRQSTGNLQALNDAYTQLMEKFPAAIGSRERTVFRALMRDNRRRIAADRFADDLSRFRVDKLVWPLLRDPGIAAWLPRELGSRFKARFGLRDMTRR